ncbi:MAG: YhcG family protein [Candidatus Sericytochromatia bacterium]
MQFEQLMTCLTETHQALQHHARKTIDTALVLRNWLFGCYLVEYEQNGEDRAVYGQRLLKETAKRLKQQGVSGMSATSLKLCRQLYFSYPQIGQTVSDQFRMPLPPAMQDLPEKALASQSAGIPVLPPAELLKRLTFSHFIELVKLDDSLQRAFYELECLKGNWSVRDLRRQIGSLLYERTGLSKDKDQLLKLTHQQALPPRSEDIIREPYVFEFLGLKEREVYQEHQLESALIRHLQDFLLELGRGFCFEARQKRITVDQEYYAIDLVFYHRLLKCHVLIELKNRKFHHQDAGQLNFYLNYYRSYEMSEGDNPPIGILLCTARDHEHVEFATSGLDNQIFVSKYKVALPSEEELRAFLVREREEWEVNDAKP